jgi:hypothetical protein
MSEENVELRAVLGRAFSTKDAALPAGLSE